MTGPVPIVYGVDFSPTMGRALRWVTRYIAPDQPAALVHAVDVPPLPGFLKNVTSHEAAVDTAIAQARERLAALRDRAEVPAAEVVVRAGRADRVIGDAAAERGASLIVIGAHAEPTRPWKRIGTTTERLLRSGEASILVARGPMTEPPRRILVAVDDVEITERVLARAGAIADASGAALHAVHVLSSAAYSHLLSAEAAEAADDTERRRRVEADLAEESLRWLRALWAHTARHAELEAHVPHGHPADEILRLAQEQSADLIVMGRYGIGRVLPAVLGSVLGTVIAGANCPVLVIAS